MRFRPLRLSQRRWKALYVVGGYLLLVAITLPAAVLLSESAHATLATALQSLWIYGGTRIFRGRNELTLPARPWWRMTARPVAGFVLGAVFAALFVYSIVNVTVEPLSFLWWTGVVEYGAFAALYVASSIRLLTTP